MGCHSCNDAMEAWRCATCRGPVYDRCAECHNELEHGRVGPMRGQPLPRHPHPRKMLEDDDQNRRSEP